MTEFHDSPSRRIPDLLRTQYIVKSFITCNVTPFRGTPRLGVHVEIWVSNTDYVLSL